MVNKEEIAQDMYRVPYNELTSREQGAVDRALVRALEVDGDSDLFDDFDGICENEPYTSGMGIEVEFGRPGSNGVKKSLVHEGTKIGEALNQTGLILNTQKEGLMVKRSDYYEIGDKVSLTDIAHDGDLYVIVPGVDSSL